MCDTLVVVGERGVLFGKNSDRAPNEAQILDWQPARTHPPGATVRCTWIEIPQARHTHAVLLSRPFWMWGAEMAANEHGVIIGNEAVFTRERVPRTGLTGMDLLRLTVERAADAETAARTLTELLTTHGQGGACDHESARMAYFSSFLIADRTRAYVVETAGREHAVERVTRGTRAISNGLTIPGFAERHSDRIKTWASECRARRARAQTVPDAAGLADILRALRDHGEGGAAPRYRWLNGAMAGPCMHAGGHLAAAQTVASWAAHLSPAGDTHLVTGTAAPCTGLFKPVSIRTPVPAALLGPAPTDRTDPASLFWRHERLHRQILRAPDRLLPLLTTERDAIEARWLQAPPPPEQAFAEASALLDRWTARIESAPRPHGERPAFVDRYWRTRDARARRAPDPRDLRKPWGTW